MVIFDRQQMYLLDDCNDVVVRALLTHPVLGLSSALHRSVTLLPAMQRKVNMNNIGGPQQLLGKEKAR